MNTGGAKLAWPVIMDPDLRQGDDWLGGRETGTAHFFRVAESDA